MSFYISFSNVRNIFPWYVITLLLQGGLWATTFSLMWTRIYTWSFIFPALAAVLKPANFVWSAPFFTFCSAASLLISLCNEACFVALLWTKHAKNVSKISSPSRGALSAQSYRPGLHKNLLLSLPCCRQRKSKKSAKSKNPFTKVLSRALSDNFN
jgi:hypothetical protein